MQVEPADALGGPSCAFVVDLAAQPKRRKLRHLPAPAKRAASVKDIRRKAQLRAAAANPVLKAQAAPQRGHGGSTEMQP
ncbi:hypothetical protein HBH56_171610 [Parastagonospora nodorum]|nr:hypothetical protein HBH56_171610 [Parastagonospora nodorum]KAH3928598.1 hypothetical protein HBH54_140170 [Parastagonospora nodorum]KAH3945346.1 hypothetical protein HBH53_145520 [Parastagonospora nodorum]KAH3983676.1 hypothetical protein HBH52_058700 [Parastagonospora nodorum]KAH3985674.1 hypothetical protein HBH51_017600 [Parastagonospora nodorum]